MKKILVTADFSGTSLSALKYGAELAKIYNAKLYLLHVAFMPTFYIDSFSNTQFLNNNLQVAIKKTKEISRANLEELVKYNFLESVDLTWDIKLGYSIYFEITNYAKKIKPDIIIMGSHSGKKGSIFNIGSNTERVIRSTEKPVLVIKKQMLPEKIKKIVFASDFKNNVKKVYPFVNSFIKAFNPEIHLLYVNTKSNFREYEDIKLQMIRFKKLFKGNFKMLVRASKNIDDGIVKYANSVNADLIALGVKRKRGLSLYFTDRITEAVISKSKIPVLAIDNPN